MVPKREFGTLAAQSRASLRAVGSLTHVLIVTDMTNGNSRIGQPSENRSASGHCGG
jgi:hypothetical protein